MENRQYTPLPPVNELGRITLSPRERAVVEPNLRRAARFFAAIPAVQKGDALVMAQLRDVIADGLSGAPVVGIRLDGKLYK